MVKKTAKKSSIKKVMRKSPVKKVSSKKVSSKKSVSKKSVSKKSVSKKSTASKKAKPVVKARTSSTPKPKAKKCNKVLLILGLIVNIVVIPGLGTLIAGGKSRQRNGIVQLVLSLLSYLLIITMVGAVIGFPLVLAMWIWSIVDMARAVMCN